MLRLFVGIELPPQLQQKLFSVAKGSNLKKARWISPGNLHLTLKFLGNCEEEKEKDIIQALKKATIGAEVFQFELNGLGGFPSEKRARIIWVGLATAQKKVICLQKKVENALSAVGFEKEKRSFHPHITLARLKIPQDICPLISQVCVDLFTKTPVKVNKIILFESHLKPTGAVYTQRAQISLS